MDLATWPAGPGLTHLPKVVFQAKFENSIFRDTLREPQVISFSIARYAAFTIEDGHVQLVFRNPKPLRRSNQFPRVGDGIFLEVIAKGKIPQHLEKRVMPVGEADIFQIVVLPTCSHTFLRRGRASIIALLQAEKNVFELIHSRVSEQQRRVVMRDEG